MSTPIQHSPRRHAYSVDDYYRMAEAGILHPGDIIALHNGLVKYFEGCVKERDDIADQI